MNPPKTEVHPPYYDTSTRNLVLQVMRRPGDTLWENDYLSKKRAKTIDRGLEYLEKTVQDISDEDKASRLKEILEEKGPLFQHTKEYYAAIEEEKERMAAYRSLVNVDVIPDGEEAEIRENPFKYLNLPEDATFGQLRAAWIRLNRTWFHDHFLPEKKEKFNMIFDDAEFPIAGYSPASWFKRMFNSKKPDELTAEQLEKLNYNEKKAYRKKHEAYGELESEYILVKSEMQRIANKKMQVINDAYNYAKKRFSEKETSSFAGFDWEKIVYPDKKGSNLDFSYERLILEGDGEIRKLIGRSWEKEEYVLVFGRRSINRYGEGTEFANYIELKSFFSWIELVQNKELSPLLLENIADNFKLNNDKKEQLRRMMMNRESIDFILKTLELSEKDEKIINLNSFIYDAYGGPTYTITSRDDFLGEAWFGYPAGFEINNNGDIVFKYGLQIFDHFIAFTEETQTFFTKNDVKIMLALAYDSLLFSELSEETLLTQN